MNESLKDLIMKSHINKPSSRLNNVTLYIALVTVCIIIWTQVKTIQLHYKTQSNGTEYLSFTSSEMDPASWPIQVKEKETILSQYSIFPPIVFAKDNDHGYPSITAIINRVNDSHDGVINVVHHLLKYPFIKEIFVYNQIKSKPLTAEYLYPNTTAVAEIKRRVNIEVIETDAALYGMGKFTACAVASFEKCYFQDDLWLNPYLDTLYTHSQRYSEHFVVNTRPVNYIDYKKWRFTNQEKSLHTGYADLRYGAFVPRQKVQTFLSQLSSQGLDTSKLKYAEIYFSIWFNQYPYMVSNPLLSFGRDRFKGIDTVNNRELIEYYMYDALSLLELSLKTSESILVEADNYFDKFELSPSEQERDIRSSCSNDRCLFITNMDTMPNVDGLQFSTDTISNTSEYESLYNQMNPLIPAQDTYIHQSYHKAVDQNTETCWNSVKNPLVGDYFGLYMAGDIKAKRVMLYTPNTFDKPLNQVFNVTVQYRIFGSWEDCKIIITPNSQLDYRIGFNINCPYGDPFKSIRIKFIENQDQPFELCSFGIDNFVV